ncbi:hypothetical protein EMIHUDRAFT_98076 [Emiliania huxleyi CCMP1516]|uniref:Redoxin domain-containing protein n=2 Tax=Emiliania huxleyi TaxID=2903 RepID=A0A0D3KR21_EMIH1|nr:hypothetical protein EMIHUDRAFT_98076 [Emiliania huxleyi CCMP1516]EOD38206.1 hypothetical protein EMIHUDRAFT_98076 [Emiliania huxleyi CCMP1516]|eukprot:XP_005790635.1 hypothetical protein EMIHUDRAFT_98076 [Emiliania huxleyi CCMP1516]
MSALHSALLLLLFSDPANALRLLPPCASPCASPCAAPRHAVRSAVVAKAPVAAKPEAAQALVEKPAGEPTEEAKAPAPSPSPLPPSYPSYSAANWFDTPDTEPKAPDPGPEVREEEVVEAAEVEAAEAAEPPASKKAAAKAGRAAKPPAKPKNAASKPASRAVRPAAAPAPAAAAADALPAAIRVGSQLPPDLTVEIAVRSKGRQTIPPTTTLGALLGSGTSVLVGMPGAFTPTCNDKHLPGLMKAAGRFARLGVSNVAVVTTNDRFVNAGWAEAVAAAAGVDSPNITMVSDPDGALVGALGLSGDMGSGLGARSQRFALAKREQGLRTIGGAAAALAAAVLGASVLPGLTPVAAPPVAAPPVAAERSAEDAAGSRGSLTLKAAEVAKEAFSREAAPKAAPEAAPEAAKPQTKAEARGEAAGAGKEEPRAAAAQSEAVADFMKTLKASLKE